MNPSPDATNFGPQRGPATLNQILAQVKQTRKELLDHRYALYQGNCLDIIPKLGPVDCIFADPFDNIGLGYDEYKDRMPDKDYIEFLDDLVTFSAALAPICWFSFNARWTFAMGRIFSEFLEYGSGDWEAKACQQVFTFGQHNKNDLGNNHRPLWRLKRKDAPLYPDAIKVPSWRERNGDKRAKPGGRVPSDVFDMQYPLTEEAIEAVAHQIVVETNTGGNNYGVKVAREHARHAIKLTLEAAQVQPGDVFDFPRVTGNSKQRCDWHPTQLHEDLVARCIKLSTPEGGTVLDPFGGTGTTLRVCKTINRSCWLIELDGGYCQKIREAHPDLVFIST